MNKRIDYAFKALVLRLLLRIATRVGCYLSESFERPVYDLISECDAIADGRKNECDAIADGRKNK